MLIIKSTILKSLAEVSYQAFANQSFLVFFQMKNSYLTFKNMQHHFIRIAFINATSTYLNYAETRQC